VCNKNYVQPFGGIPVPLSYYDGVPMQAWGSGAAIPPPNFAVPNVAFAEPYEHLPQPQQNVATIGGYAARNMQNIAAILTVDAKCAPSAKHTASRTSWLHTCKESQDVPVNFF
jgi:hypothetical protein